MDPPPSVSAYTKKNIRIVTLSFSFLLVILLGLAGHRLAVLEPPAAPTLAPKLVALDAEGPRSSPKQPRTWPASHSDLGPGSNFGSDAASRGAERNAATEARSATGADANETASLTSNIKNPAEGALRPASPQPPSASFLVLKALYPSYDLSSSAHLASLDLDVLRPAKGRWVRWNDDADVTLRRDVTANRRCPLRVLYPSCSSNRTAELLRYEWVEGEGTGDGGVGTRPKAEPRGQSLAVRLGRLRGKSVLLAGDSLTKQQFVSLSCMYFEAGYGLNVTKEGPDNLDLHVSVPELSLHLRFVFAAYLMNASVTRADKTKTVIDLGRLDDRIVRIVRDDHPEVLLFNTGAWSGVSTFGPNLTEWTNRYLGLVSAFHFELQSLLRREYGRLGGERMSNGSRSGERTRDVASARQPVVVWRTTTQSHFELGDWNTGGNCGRTAPCVAAQGRSQSQSQGRDRSQSGGESRSRSQSLDPADVATTMAAWLGLFGPKADSEIQNALAERAMLEATRPRSCDDGTASRDSLEERSRVRSRDRDVGPFPVWVLDAQAMSRERCDAHVGEHRKKDVTVKDCIHWCLPGVVDTWNVALLDHLAS